MRDYPPGVVFLLAQLAVGAFLLPTSCVGGAADDGTCAPAPATVTATVSYRDDILPVFIDTGCLSTACHGGLFASADYDLRSYQSTFRSGDSARRLELCEVVPGDPVNSFLLEKLRDADPRSGLRMPLEGDPLTPEQLELVETWIREGAQDN